jgi:hypothetical protein
MVGVDHAGELLTLTRREPAGDDRRSTIDELACDAIHDRSMPCAMHEDRDSWHEKMNNKHPWCGESQFFPFFIYRTKWVIGGSEGSKGRSSTSCGRIWVRRRIVKVGGGGVI